MDWFKLGVRCACAMFGQMVECIRESAIQKLIRSNFGWILTQIQRITRTFTANQRSYLRVPRFWRADDGGVAGYVVQRSYWSFLWRSHYNDRVVPDLLCPNVICAAGFSERSHQIQCVNITVLITNLLEAAPLETQMNSNQCENSGIDDVNKNDDTQLVVQNYWAFSLQLIFSENFDLAMARRVFDGRSDCDWQHFMQRQWNQINFRFLCVVSIKRIVDSEWARAGSENGAHRLHFIIEILRQTHFQ